MTSNEAYNFNENYKQLQTIAEKLKRQDADSIDIDDLLKDVKIAADSYKLCKERLKKAGEQLNSIFENSEDLAVEDHTEN